MRNGILRDKTSEFVLKADTDARLSLALALLPYTATTAGSDAGVL